MRWLEYGTCIIVTHLDEGEAVEIPIGLPVKLWAKYPPTTQLRPEGQEPMVYVAGIDDLVTRWAAEKKCKKCGAPVGGYHDQ